MDSLLRLGLLGLKWIEVWLSGSFMQEGCELMASLQSLNEAQFTDLLLRDFKSYVGTLMFLTL